MQKFHFEFRAMACDNLIELYAASEAEASAAAHEAIEEVARIEKKYSRYTDDSVVSRINAAAGGEPVAIDGETSYLLDYAATCFEQSGGLFDITSGVLRRAWNFKAERPPERSAIEPLLPLIGWRWVERSGLQVRLPKPGMEIDFGGFGKEYAVDRAAAVLMASGIGHAFVSLGGDVMVVGPHADGTPWRLGIRHPRRLDAAIAQMPVASGAIATSGDYERFLEYAGHRHSHILDPRTGESVHGFQSVTALAPSCLVAGSITTIAMLKGEVSGMAWLRHCGAIYLVVTAAGEVLSNAGNA